MEPSSFYQTLFAALNRGLLLSLALIIPSALGGAFLGLLTGGIRAHGPRWARRLGDFYAALFRGTPLAVQLVILYFGLPGLHIRLSPYWAAVIGFMLCSGAYQSEYVRGAFLSIRRGQHQAALALGFGRAQTLIHIILPQAFRRALHGCGNEVIYLIKYSSLAYIVTCMELTGQGKTIATESFRFTEVFLGIAAYYLVLTSLAMLGLKWLERRLAIPGMERR